MRQRLRRGGGFNVDLSDSLPLDRDLVDSRDKECRIVAYTFDDEKDTLSVIIIFYNEPFSTLFRSVHSVLNRTPPSLLLEIILVDDGSDLDWIQETGSGLLDRYVALLPKTRLIRGRTRQGIVPARLLGIRNAKGRFFVILDSHIEVNTQWAEPLVTQLRLHPNAVAMPQIDSIDPETFTPNRGGIGCTLGFLWKLIEHGYVPDSRSPPERQNKNSTDVISSPTMAGGLFAANTHFFLYDLGGYDEEFSFWGTENLELSFRTWMCGGSILCIPCSRVYHIFRKGGSGYQSPGDSVTKNKMRLLSTWMDEYADLAWRVIGKPRVNYGSVEELKQWRKEKGCHSFNWFLHHVNPESDVLDIYTDVPYLGPLVNDGTGRCLSTAGYATPGVAITLKSCYGDSNQDWMYFRRAQHWMPVSDDECCLVNDKSSSVATDWCSPTMGRWMFDEETRFIHTNNDNPDSFPDKKKLCLTGELTNHVTVKDCNVSNPNQKWSPKEYNPPATFDVSMSLSRKL